MHASVIEITPKGRSPYYWVCVAGRGHLARRFSDPIPAIAYQRKLRTPWRLSSEEFRHIMQGP